VRVLRTNIDINNDLMQRAMLLSGSKTKKEAVELAMTEFVERRTRKNLADLRGKIEFAEGYDYKAARAGRQ
jgi:Arc/MetJ family transcription regulator